MPYREIHRRLDALPLSSLCLKYTLYKRLEVLGAISVLDLFLLPDEAIIQHHPMIAEGLARIMRNYDPPL